MELIVQSLPQSDAEDLEISVRLNHGTSIAIDLAHPLEQHGSLSGSLLTYDEIVVTNATSGNNVIDFELFISRNPVLFVASVILARNHTRDFESRVTWTERMIDLVQDQVLVVLVVRVARRSVRTLVGIVMDKVVGEI